MKDILSWSGSGLALLLYIPTLYFIWSGELKQSFATWILWVALDAIALGSIIQQGGENTLILKCYIAGGTLVWVSLLLKKQFTWTWIETGTVLLVILCLVIWKISGPWWATIASTSAVCISAMPQYLASRAAERDRITGIIYFGYAIVNVLFFLAGKSWTVEDKFYAGMVIPLCLMISWAAFKKRPPIPMWIKSFKFT